MDSKYVGKSSDLGYSMPLWFAWTSPNTRTSGKHAPRSPVLILLSRLAFAVLVFTIVECRFGTSGRPLDRDTKMQKTETQFFDTQSSARPRDPHSSVFPGCFGARRGVILAVVQFSATAYDDLEPGLHGTRSVIRRDNSSTGSLCYPDRVPVMLGYSDVCSRKRSI